jgi:hypothetical protein
MIAMLICSWGAVSFAADSGSFYCNNQVISIGGSLPEVLSKCGLPIWVDASESETVTRLSAREWRTVQQTTTVCFYAWGANKLTRILTFENSVLTTIATSTDTLTAIERPCQFSALTAGMAKFEVLARCGKPTFEQRYRVQELTKVSALLQDDPDEWELVRTPTEEWVYQPVSNPLVGVLTFKDNRLREIKTIKGTLTPLSQTCLSPGIAPGMTKAEVLGHCGLPIWQTDRKKTANVSAPNGRIFTRDIIISEWAYQLPDQATATLTFQDGRLMEIEGLLPEK